MRTYSDLDEEVELVERLVDDVRLTDGNVMENHEEYCEMKQYEVSEEYWLNMENNELSRQWDEW